MNRALEAVLVAVSALLVLSHAVEAAQPTRLQNQSMQNRSEWRLSPRGFGPISLGMPLQDVARTSGVTFRRNRIEDSEVLDYELKGDPGAINVSVCPTGPLRGRIMAIQFYANSPVTDRGIHILDSAEELVRSYGPLLKPVDAGQYAKFYTYYRYEDSQDSRYSVLFTVSRTDPNRNRVTEISASFKDSRCEH